MARVAVVGAGVGGLAAAIRLSLAGHRVLVFEKNECAGGKLASHSRNGFTFDIGPSLLTLPHMFDELGVSLSRERLAEPFRYTFTDKSTLVVQDKPNDTRKAFTAFALGSGSEWDRMLQRGKKVWEISERTFFSGPMSSPLQLLKRMRSPFDLRNIDAKYRLAERSKRTFDDPRLQQWLNRYATYSGSSPYLAPATLGCIPYVEQRYGCWYVSGGLASITKAMVQRAEDLGVRFYYNTPVTKITKSRRHVTGVSLGNGKHAAADVVIANVDAEIVYSKLLPNILRRARVKRAGRSTSGFAMTLGLRGRTPDLRHHNVWFSSDYEREFTEIAKDGVAFEPTIYVCCSAVTDPSVAPDGYENWFVLVNVAADAEQNWDAYGDRIIDRLGIRDRLEFRDDFGPKFFRDRYNAPGGAIYGASANGRRAAFLRAKNKGPVGGLYLVGGSSHPGGGLPLVLTSARIVADMVGR